MPVFGPLGDSALLIKFGDEIELALNRSIHDLAARLAATPIAGLTGLVPAYASLLVHYDPLQQTYAAVADWARAALDQLQPSAARKPRRIEVPVRYGGETGPDLEAVAAAHGLSAAEVIRLHSARDYTVYMMGFTPGFPYMGRLDDALVTPRLESPRTHVSAGTVAIAGAQTGIYPIDSPGGWRLIGWTPLKLFDPGRESPFLFAPGDAVHFVPLPEGRNGA